MTVASGAEAELCMRTMIYGGIRALFCQQSWQSQNGFPPRTPEIPSVHHEASAGGLREVAHGEDAFWAMNAGRDAVTSTKQEGSFYPRDLYGAVHGAIFVRKTV